VNVARGMRRGTPLGAMLVAVIALASATTHASDRLQFEAAGRAGFGLALGNVDTAPGDRLDQTSPGMVPFGIDFGVRLQSRWRAGAYFDFAPAAFVGDALKRLGSGNAVRVARFGGEAAYHLRPEGPFDPWFGAGFGAEWLWAANSAGSTSLSGVEMLLEGGLDMPFAPEWSWGPFVGATFGAYTSLPNPDVHEWALVGVRVVALFGGGASAQASGRGDGSDP